MFIKKKKRWSEFYQSVTMVAKEQTIVISILYLNGRQGANDSDRHTLPQ